MFALLQLAVFALGASLGSFLAVCVVRLPDGRSLWSPPSSCPTCGTRLSWFDNVPLLSWLWLRARCRTCETPIPPMYPLLELVSGLLAWLLFRRFVPGAWALDPAHLAVFFVYLGIGWLLLVAAFVDARSYLIPTMASVGAVPFAVAGVALVEWLGWEGWLSIGWQGSVLGALAGGGGLGAMAWLWKVVFGREGVGGGDPRLFALVGAAVGPLPGVPLVLLLASFLGALQGLVALIGARRSVYLPWGPAITLAALGYILFGDRLLVRAAPLWSVWT